MTMIETKQQSLPEAIGDELDPALGIPWTEVLDFDRQTFDDLGPVRDVYVRDTSRLGAAPASGAQFLSTDYYVPDEVLGYDFVVDLPGQSAARCNPVNAPDGCDLTDG